MLKIWFSRYLSVLLCILALYQKRKDEAPDRNQEKVPANLC